MREQKTEVPEPTNKAYSNGATIAAGTGIRDRIGRDIHGYILKLLILLWLRGETTVLGESRRLLAILKTRRVLYETDYGDFEGFTGDQSKASLGKNGVFNDKEDGLLTQAIALMLYALWANPGEHPDNRAVVKEWSAWLQRNMVEKWLAKRGLMFLDYKSAPLPIDRIMHAFLSSVISSRLLGDITGDARLKKLHGEMLEAVVPEFRVWERNGVPRIVWRTAVAAASGPDGTWRDPGQVHLGPYIYMVAGQCVLMGFLGIKPFQSDAFMTLFANSLEHSVLVPCTFTFADGRREDMETYVDLFGPEVSSLNEREIRRNPFTDNIGDDTTGPIMATQALVSGNTEGWFRTVNSYMQSEGVLLLPWMSDKLADWHARQKKTMGAAVGFEMRESYRAGVWRFGP